jgi:hypothetical protein
MNKSGEGGKGFDDGMEIENADEEKFASTSRAESNFPLYKQTTPRKV